MTNLHDEYAADVIEQAERELHEDAFREEVERVKAVLLARSARFERFVRFSSLIRAAFNELFATTR